jgi:hypothetical protein
METDQHLEKLGGGVKCVPDPLGSAGAQPLQGAATTGQTKMSATVKTIDAGVLSSPISNRAPHPAGQASSDMASLTTSTPMTRLRRSWLEAGAGVIVRYLRGFEPTWFLRRRAQANRRPWGRTFWR